MRKVKSNISTVTRAAKRAKLRRLMETPEQREDRLEKVRRRNYIARCNQNDEDRARLALAKKINRAKISAQIRRRQSACAKASLSMKSTGKGKTNDASKKRQAKKSVNVKSSVTKGYRAAISEVDTVDVPVMDCPSHETKLHLDPLPTETVLYFEINRPLKAEPEDQSTEIDGDSSCSTQYQRNEFVKVEIVSLHEAATDLG